jgi:hypothetical protein
LREITAELERAGHLNERALLGGVGAAHARAAMRRHRLRHLLFDLRVL